MAIFNEIRKGLQKFTPAGWAGLYDDNSVNYNDLFASQMAIYNQQIAERNRMANAADVTNANLASTTILTGGSKPSDLNMGNMRSNDFTARTASDAAVTGVSDLMNPAGAAQSTEGLTGDSLALQRQRNKEATDKFLRSIAAGANFGGRV